MRSRFFANNPGSAAADTPRSCVSRTSHVTTPEEIGQHQSSGHKSRFFKKGRLAEGVSADVEFTENADTPACTICFEQLLARTVARLNCCSHWFCFACIAKWSKQSNACPLCKRKITKIIHKNGKEEFVVRSPIVESDDHEEDDDAEEYDRRYYSSGEETDLSGFLVPDTVIEEDESDGVDGDENANLNQVHNSTETSALLLRPRNRIRTRRLVLSSSSEDED